MLAWSENGQFLPCEAQIPFGFAQGKLFTPLRFFQDDRLRKNCPESV